jgi:hypothetical protein
MRVSKTEYSITKYNQQQYELSQRRLEKQRIEDYAKKIDERRFDQIIAERVRRNIRLHLDRGQYIDIAG